MSPSRRRAVGVVSGLESYKIRTRIYVLGAPPRCARHYPCAFFARALPGRRDVPIAPPRLRPWRLATRAATPSARCAAWHHAKFARNIRTRITRAARWGHRALPPLRTHPHPRIARGGSPPRGGSPLAAGPSGLCAPIHPAQKLFVPLCVKNTVHYARALPVERGARHTQKRNRWNYGLFSSYW